jgi:hydrogenase maturation protease
VKAGRVLVVGLGHPYRGDDGIGIRAAEEFEATNQDSTVEVMVAQELLPELAEDISRIDLLVFLDARAGGVPGSVEVSEVKPAELGSGVFIHTLTMETLLSAAGNLFGHAPEAMLISVAGESFDFASHLSPNVEAALPLLLEKLREVIYSGDIKSEPLALLSSGFVTC